MNELTDARRYTLVASNTDAGSNPSDERSYQMSLYTWLDAIASWRPHPWRVALVVLAFGLVICVLDQPDRYRTVHADTQLDGGPRAMRAAHLAADPVAGRIDYVFFEGPNNGMGAYDLGGQLLFTLPPFCVYTVCIYVT